MSIFTEIEADLLRQYQSITPEQLAAEDLQRKLQREEEAKRTKYESESDRADADEYPEDEPE
jgi:hypothetical protein